MKLVIVTKDSKCDGKSIYELLARKLSLEAVQSLKEKGLSAKYHQLGITNSENWHKLADFVKREHPNGPHIIVNNTVRATIETNYTATV
ncbi:unnamed protein product [Hymenolepis diminuta]|uniref:40S ribosomal protein S12 n=1 Tax=Hymenolepis diminuta TaxID=6216 RepID=A0A0R3SHP8_HYMDI|nr:unnamed protein product [Hymenolepis diminuta]